MLIDGKAIAQKIYTDLASRIAKLPFQPIFCDVLVGDDPASVQYVAMKARVAERVGIKFLQAHIAETITQAELVLRIQELGRTKNLCGLIVQLPLPLKFNLLEVLSAIPPLIDVDCLNPENIDLFYSNKGKLMPPTASAVLAVLESVEAHLSTKTVVVVGNGALVGRPVAHLLTLMGASVKVITSHTESPAVEASSADIIIAGVGKPKLITGDWVKPGAIVIDAGTSEDAGSIVGDVDVESVLNKTSYLSPTPGGVGPVTVAKLLENVVLVAEHKVKGG